MEEFGIDRLKNELMEGVSVEKISEKNIEWCERKWKLLVKELLPTGKFSAEVFRNPEAYYSKFVTALEIRIKALGGKVSSMRSIEIPQNV